MAGLAFCCRNREQARHALRTCGLPVKLAAQTYYPLNWAEWATRDHSEQTRLYAALVTAAKQFDDPNYPE